MNDIGAIKPKTTALVKTNPRWSAKNGHLFGPHCKYLVPVAVAAPVQQWDRNNSSSGVESHPIPSFELQFPNPPPAAAHFNAIVIKVSNGGIERVKQSVTKWWENSGQFLRVLESSVKSNP